jgi:hypothetical protein
MDQLSAKENIYSTYVQSNLALNLFIYVFCKEPDRNILDLEDHLTTVIVAVCRSGSPYINA